MALLADGVRVTKARLAREVGTRAWLRIYWDGACTNGTYHNAMRFLADTSDIRARGFAGTKEDFQDPHAWPNACVDCGLIVPADGFLGDLGQGGPIYQILEKRLYDTPSGAVEPGCLYWASWYHDHGANGCYCAFWDDCADPRGHLLAVLPNGWTWDIDSRASNCGLPGDRLHRCWVRSGDVPQITVDKRGVTCHAGGGSILIQGRAGVADYHGLLTDGEFRPS